MTTLTFNDVKLNPISQADNQIWLGATQLGLALNYANPETAVTKIYNRKADEFNSSMTKLVEIKTNGGLQKIRIFSLRGCHLIAMFARTEIAKKFRIWVLDILDKEVGEPKIIKTTTDDRTPLRQAVTALVGKAKIKHDDAYNMVNQYMSVNHIWEISKEDLPKAVAYVHSLALMASQPTQNTSTPDQIKTAMLANTQSYRYLSILQHEVNTMNQHLQQMLNLNVEIDRRLVAFD